MRKFNETDLFMIILMISAICVCVLILRYC